MEILTERREVSRATILFVVNHAGFFLSHRLPLAIGAREAGYDVRIATPESKHVARIIENGLPWYPIRLQRSSTNPLTEFRSVLDLIRLYRTLKPDIVHQVTNKVVLYGTTAARIARVPGVVNAISGLGHVFGSDRLRDRLILRFVALAYSLALRHRNMRVIFQNEEQQSSFMERGWVRVDEAVLIRGSGVDTQLFRPGERRSRGDRIVLFASRLIRTKGIDLFVEAAIRLREKHPDVRFVIVGEPDPDNPASVTRKEVEAWAEEPRIECWGRRSDMQEVIAMADVFCLPTMYPEGVPKVLIEAAACGVPIITSDIPGCRDIVLDGVNGFTTRPGDLESFISALDTMLENPKEASQKGAMGRRRVIEGGFRLSDVVTQTLDVYAELSRQVGR